MKRVIAFLVCALLLVTTLVPAFATSYSDTSYPLYRIWTLISTNGLYMYKEPNSSGTPIATYKRGELLRVTRWYVDNSVCCFAIGPDGTEGYVNKSCLLRQYDYNDSSLASYKVNSPNKTNGNYLLYMYPSPSSSTDPVGVGGYYNGTVLKIVDWNVDKTYAYCVGPDGLCGFVRKEYLEYVSGTLPTESLAPTEYYWPGRSKNVSGSSSSSSGSSSSGSSGSGSSSSGSSSSGSSGWNSSGSSSWNSSSSYGSNGSTLTPPAGYGNRYYGGSSAGTAFTVSASSFAASGSENCDPTKAIDNDAYTSWNTNGEREGAWIELISTSGPRTVNGLRIQNGYHRRQTSSSLYYYRYSRVKSFSLYVDGIYVMSGKLDDTFDWQNVPFGYQITGTVFTIFIDSVYQGTGTPESNYGVCITDILLI